MMKTIPQSVLALLRHEWQPCRNIYDAARESRPHVLYDPSYYFYRKGAKREETILAFTHDEIVALERDGVIPVKRNSSNGTVVVNENYDHALGANSCLKLTTHGANSKSVSADRMDDAMTPTERFLAKARCTEDPAGDLIADMRRDANVPRLFASIGEMRDYLVSRSACREALEAVPVVWRRYRGFLDRNPA